jgi:hypothetical protein
MKSTRYSRQILIKLKFSKKKTIKICPFGDKFFPADGRKDRQDKSNNRCCNFSNAPETACKSTFLTSNFGEFLISFQKSLYNRRIYLILSV